MKILVFN